LVQTDGLCLCGLVVRGPLASEPILVLLCVAEDQVIASLLRIGASVLADARTRVSFSLTVGIVSRD
jgi:hypothetical protein